MRSRRPTFPIAVAASLAVAVMLCANASADDTSLADLPEPLRAMLRARQRIERADAYMSRSYPQLDREPVFIRLRLAGRDRASLHLGTPSGWFGRDPQDRPVRLRPMGFLQLEDQWWQHNLATVEADRYTGQVPSSVPCYSSLGLLPGIDAMRAPPARTLRDALWQACGDGYRFAVRRRNGLHVVEARSADGRQRIVWHLDPELDFNPVRVESWHDDRLSMSCHSEYQRIGGVFVPVSVAYYNAEGRLGFLDMIHEVRVNDPDLPERLLPEHIGMQPGTTVHDHRPDGRPARFVYVSGGRVVSDREFRRLLRTGDVALGPAVRAMRAGRQPALAAVDPQGVYRRIIDEYVRRKREAEYDPWLIYTQRFIERYALDAEQRQKAMEILRSCQLERDHYLRTRRPRLDELEKLVSRTKNPARRSPMLKELRALREPIERIFERKLKPRLERLPTRAQRRAAERRDADTP